MHDSTHHYKVVRYYPHPGHGVIAETLDDDLTMEAAEECVRAHPPTSHEEEIMIVDQDRQGLEAIVSVTRLD